MRWDNNIFKYKTPLYRGELLIASIIGAVLTLLAIGLVSRYFLPEEYPYLVASMGAAVVMVFMAPGNLMAQPWPLVAGHLVSAFVGVSCVQLVSDKLYAAVCAIFFALILMHYLRCMHPPGGAAALIPIVGGEQFTDLGFWYVIAPVGINALTLLAFALVFLNLLSKRTYPAQYGVVGDKQADLQQYLQRDPYVKEYLAKSSEKHPYSCKDVMLPFSHTISDATSPEEIQSWMANDDEKKGFIAVSASGKLVGLATVASLSLGLGALEQSQNKQFKQGVLSEVNLERVAAVREDLPVDELLPLIENQGVERVVIVDHEYRPLGWFKPPTV